MFPVEEAIVVQKFLEEVGNIVDEEMEEEMSSEQLMEKLEQLEVCTRKDTVWVAPATQQIY